MNFRTSRILMIIGFVIGILIMAIGIAYEKYMLWFLAVGIIIYVLGFIQALIFYNCPHCKYCLLNVRGSVPDFCPYCGGSLKE